MITADDRLDKLAEDFVEHCSTRWQTGKSMVVCIDKITCARMSATTQAEVRVFILDQLYESLPRPPFSEAQRASRVYRATVEGQARPDSGADPLRQGGALLHGPEQIADLPVPVAESPGAVRIGHPERSHLVEYLAPNSVFNSLPRQRSRPHLRPDDRLVTIDRVLHHASLGVA